QKMPVLTNLWWRAQAKDTSSLSLSASNWSKPWKFYTTLAAPVLISPPNGDAKQFVDLTLRWDTSRTASDYEFSVSKDTIVNIDQKTLGDNFKDIQNLDYNQKYCWKVRAYNEDGFSEWSDTWCFTTSLQAPIDAIPLDSSVNLDTLVNFSWTKVPKATSYKLRIGTEPTLTNNIITDTVTTKNGFSKKLDFYKNYWWTVVAFVDQTQGINLKTRIFKTTIDKPVLDKPDNHSLAVNGQDAKLHWIDVENSKGYTVQYSKNKDFKDSVTSSGITVNDFQMPKLDYNAKYYWRVAGETPEGKGYWSDTWDFNTAANPNNVNDIISKEYQVELYPNPFESSITLKFNTRQTGNVNVSIYNEAGSK